MSQNAGLDQAWTFITTRDYKMIAILQLRVYYSEKKKTLHFNKIRCIKPRKHRKTDYLCLCFPAYLINDQLTWRFLSLKCF